MCVCVCVCVCVSVSVCVCVCVCARADFHGRKFKQREIGEATGATGINQKDTSLKPTFSRSGLLAIKVGKSSSSGTDEVTMIRSTIASNVGLITKLPIQPSPRSVSCAAESGRESGKGGERGLVPKKKLKTAPRNKSHWKGNEKQERVTKNRTTGQQFHSPPPLFAPSQRAQTCCKWAGRDGSRVALIAGRRSWIFLILVSRRAWYLTSPTRSAFGRRVLLVKPEGKKKRMSPLLRVGNWCVCVRAGNHRQNPLRSISNAGLDWAGLKQPHRRCHRTHRPTQQRDRQTAKIQHWPGRRTFWWWPRSGAGCRQRS